MHHAVFIIMSSEHGIDADSIPPLFSVALALNDDFFIKEEGTVEQNSFDHLSFDIPECLSTDFDLVPKFDLSESSSIKSRIGTISPPTTKLKKTFPVTERVSGILNPLSKNIDVSVHNKAKSSLNSSFSNFLTSQLRDHSKRQKELMSILSLNLTSTKTSGLNKKKLSESNHSATSTAQSLVKEKTKTLYAFGSNMEHVSEPIPLISAMRTAYSDVNHKYNDCHVDSISNLGNSLNRSQTSFSSTNILHSSFQNQIKKLDPSHSTSYDLSQSPVSTKKTTNLNNKWDTSKTDLLSPELSQSFRKEDLSHSAIFHNFNNKFPKDVVQDKNNNKIVKYDGGITQLKNVLSTNNNNNVSNSISEASMRISTKKGLKNCHTSRKLLSPIEPSLCFAPNTKDPFHLNRDSPPPVHALNSFDKDLISRPKVTAIEARRDSFMNLADNGSIMEASLLSPFSSFCMKSNHSESSRKTKKGVSNIDLHDPNCDVEINVDSNIEYMENPHSLQHISNKTIPKQLNKNMSSLRVAKTDDMRNKSSPKSPAMAAAGQYITHLLQSFKEAADVANNNSPTQHAAILATSQRGTTYKKPSKIGLGLRSMSSESRYRNKHQQLLPNTGSTSSASLRSNPGMSMRKSTLLNDNQIRPVTSIIGSSSSIPALEREKETELENIWKKSKSFEHEKKHVVFKSKTTFSQKNRYQARLSGKLKKTNKDSYKTPSIQQKNINKFNSPKCENAIEVLVDACENALKTGLNSNELKKVEKQMEKVKSSFEQSGQGINLKRLKIATHNVEKRAVYVVKKCISGTNESNLHINNNYNISSSGIGMALRDSNSQTKFNHSPVGNAQSGSDCIGHWAGVVVVDSSNRKNLKSSWTN